MSRFRTVWHGRRVSQEVEQASMEGLNEAGDALLFESNKKVPHDEGTLMRSGAVTEEPEELAVYVSYDTPYAVRLHEHPNYKFRNGRTGKWLENALKANQADLEAYIADRLKEILR